MLPLGSLEVANAATNGRSGLADPVLAEMAYSLVHVGNVQG